jgi:hypothetical protein
MSASAGTTEPTGTQRKKKHKSAKKNGGKTKKNTSHTIRVWPQQYVFQLCFLLICFFNGLGHGKSNCGVISGFFFLFNYV